MLSKEMFENRARFDNPWWTSGRTADCFEHTRPRLALDEIYAQVTNWNLNRATLIMGPRRVGKTWLMQHLVGRLLANAFVPAQNIIFISVDVPIYQGSGLEALVSAVAEINGLDVQSDRMVVLFDEIQYLKDWEVHLKTLVESYRNIRFVASGSAATVLQKGSYESGAGRFSDFRLAPLSFYEYVDLIGEKWRFSNQTLKVEGSEGIFPSVESLEWANGLFLEYLNYGGYPELVANRAVRENPVQFVQRDIVDKVLLRDLPSLYHIEDVRDLQSFFSYIAFHSGAVQSWESMAQGTGLRKAMITAFLKYLEDAFLIVRHDRVDITAKSLQRATQFKVYLTNTSLRAAMFQPVEMPDDPYLGAMVETALSAQMGIGEERNAWRYANWTSGRKQGEVDFVRIHAGTQRPDVALECKWSDGPFDHPAELGSAVGFCQKNGLSRLWVTTRSQRGVRRMGDLELVYVPTALFAYQLGAGGVFK